VDIGIGGRLRYLCLRKEASCEESITFREWTVEGLCGGNKRGQKEGVAGGKEGDVEFTREKRGGKSRRKCNLA